MDQQSPMLNFILLHQATSDVGPRLGQLARAGRKTIKTPNYVALTSRGVVPHISHDTLRRHTAVAGVYIGLEDC
jgi:queuine tRNA-ribosyltransferase accessory subunit